MKNKTFGFKKSSKKAFTLIELSIVLIIIGLLIVAITSGQALIKNAQLRSITNEALQYKTMVNSFYSKFDAYPGDFNQAMSTSGIAGNGDAIIQWEGSTAPEGITAWAHLRADGMIDTSDVSHTTSLLADLTLEDGTHMPGSTKDNTGWVLAASDTISTNNFRNYVTLSGHQIAATFSGTLSNITEVSDGTANLLKGALSHIDAFSIDNKNDDGLSNAGQIIGFDTTVDNTCDAAYDIDSTDGDYRCAIGFDATVE